MRGWGIAGMLSESLMRAIRRGERGSFRCSAEGKKLVGLVVNLTGIERHKIRGLSLFLFFLSPYHGF